MRLGVIIIQCLCLAACHVLFKYTYPGHITSYRRVRFGLNLTALQDVGEYRLIVSCIYSASCSQSLLNVSAVDILGYSTYQLWNFQPTNISFSVAMVSSDPNLPKLESSILSILSGNSDEAYVVAILTQENTAGYILPFNLFPLTSYGVGVVQEMPMLLQPYLETTEPFVSTYWNELQTTTVLLPWIPYFSACSLSTPGLILVDLIKPSDCTIASRVYGQEIVCTDKL